MKMCTSYQGKEEYQMESDVWKWECTAGVTAMRNGRRRANPCCGEPMAIENHPNNWRSAHNGAGSVVRNESQEHQSRQKSTLSRKRGTDGY
jgi:hypothetical protein